MAMAKTKRLKIEYTPTEKQALFHGLVEQNLVSLFCGGVGSGKTMAGCQEMIRQAFVKQPKSYGGVFAPTYPMLRDATMRTVFEILPPELTDAFIKSENRLPLPTGGDIIFRSTEHPERNRGPNLDWAWLDEPGLMPKAAYDVILGRVRGSDKRKIWLTTTPKGSQHWLAGEFTKAIPDRAVVFASSRDNPHLPTGFVDQLLQTYSGKFAEQEIEGRFVSFEGLIYNMLEDALHVCERPVSEMREFYAGVDWGYTNPGVIVVAGLDGDGRMHGFEEVYQSGKVIDWWVERAHELMGRYPIQRFLCDPSEPAYIRQFCDAGLPAVAADNEVLPGITELCGLLAVAGDGRPRWTCSGSMAQSYADLRQYQWKTKPDGSMAKEEPLKVKDHGCDAWRYVARVVKSAVGAGVSILVVPIWGEEQEENDAIL